MSREVDGMNSGNPTGATRHGNPEPSRRYTAGRCRDYLRAGFDPPNDVLGIVFELPLITGKSVPHPTDFDLPKRG
jgi:hypothetical protein